MKIGGAGGPVRINIMDQINQPVQNQPAGGQQNAQPQPQKRSSWQETLQLVNTILVPAQEVVIVIRQNPSFDTLAGSLALAGGMRKIGRKCHVISPMDLSSSSVLNSPTIDKKALDLIDISQIVNFFPKKQLRLVIDYMNGSFSKGNIKKGTDGLLLTLMPEAGQTPIEPLNMVTQLVESKPDAILTVEVESLFHLQNFYNDNKTIFDKTPIVNIDFHQTNAYYGKANLIDPKSTCLCEMITLMLYDLRFAIDAEMAKLLYEGIKVSSNNFAAGNFSANMLEAASICLRYQQPPPPVAPTQ